MPGPEILDVPPEEAIRHFRAKGYHVGFDWRDTAAALHVRSFTVAKAARLDVLTAIRAAVDQSIADGAGYRAFRQRLEPELVRLGWWGQQIRTDPETGKERVVQLGSPRRLRTIWQTNLRTAYAHGRWARIQRLRGEIPYLRYVAVEDERTRPEHRAWHGVVLPIDDVWWDTHYPPNGWNCRCTVMQLSRAAMKRHGYQVTGSRPPFSSSGDKVPWRNKRTGQVHQVPRGIDPGWSHNVGKVKLERDAADALIGKIDRAPDDLARAAVGNPWDTPEFARHLTGASDADWPVAVLDGAVLAAIRGTSRTVRLSRSTAQKQVERREGQKFSAADYSRVQEILDHGELFLAKDRIVIGFATAEPDRPWRAVLKSTKDGAETYLLTLHRVNRQHLRHARRQFAEVRGE